jgi:hypothetical protein
MCGAGWYPAAGVCTFLRSAAKISLGHRLQPVKRRRRSQIPKNLPKSGQSCRPLAAGHPAAIALPDPLRNPGHRLSKYWLLLPFHRTTAISPFPATPVFPLTRYRGYYRRNPTPVTSLFSSSPFIDGYISAHICTNRRSRAQRAVATGHATCGSGKI